MRETFTTVSIILAVALWTWAIAGWYNLTTQALGV